MTLIPAIACNQAEYNNHKNCEYCRGKGYITPSDLLRLQRIFSGKGTLKVTTYGKLKRGEAKK